VDVRRGSAKISLGRKMVRKQRISGQDNYRLPRAAVVWVGGVERARKSDQWASCDRRGLGPQHEAMAPEHHRHPEPQADGNRQIDVLATEALDDENLSRSKDSAAAPKPVFKQGRAPG